MWSAFVAVVISREKFDRSFASSTWRLSPVWSITTSCVLHSSSRFLFVLPQTIRCSMKRFVCVYRITKKRLHEYTCVRDRSDVSIPRYVPRWLPRRLFPLWVSNNRLLCGASWSTKFDGRLFRQVISRSVGRDENETEGETEASQTAIERARSRPRIKLGNIFLARVTRPILDHVVLQRNGAAWIGIYRYRRDSFFA